MDAMRSLTGDQLTSLTDAELVALIRRAIEADETYRAALMAELEDPDSPYQRAEKAFREIDEQVTALRSEIDKADDPDEPSESDEPAELDELAPVDDPEAANGLEGLEGVDEQEARDEQQQRDEEVLNESDSEDALDQAKLESLVEIRELLNERFNLAIERRRLISQMIPALEARITQKQRTLAAALGETSNSVETLPTVDEATPTPSASAPEPDAPSAPPIPIIPGMPLPSPAESSETAVEVEQDSAPRSEEFERAESEAARWERILEPIQTSLSGLELQLSTTDQVLELERGLSQNSRLTLDNAESLRRLYSERFQEASLAGADTEVLQQLQESLREFVTLSRETRELSRTSADRVTTLIDERGYILEALATRNKDLELAEANLTDARREVARVVNPFNPRNLFRWFLDHGPQIIAILLGMVLLYLFVEIMGSRIVRMLASRGVRGSKEERLSRASTLVSSFRQASTLAIIVGGSMMILDEIGIPIGPLLGGAAVLGLAVAFGAQNLLKDFFQGFMILLENQYKLNDVVQIGAHSGLVEQITLRTTVLRGLDGTLHFIPNGQIEAVSNMTHGWSRALFDMPVAYNEDVDRVIELLLEICHELRADKKYGHLILEDATMLGVDDFADSAVIIKFFMKTIPLQQWAVRRELLRRIKNRFDAEGIEIPYPHRTLYLRSADGAPLERSLSESFASKNNGEN